ncbi:unnamed protein product [Discosporangium mesarthrocarpum]
MDEVVSRGEKPALELSQGRAEGGWQTKSSYLHIFDAMDEKRRSQPFCGLFTATPSFVDALCELSRTLSEVSRESRTKVLKERLKVVNDTFLPSRVIYLPVGRKRHRVFRICSEESFAFSTKSRVPFLATLEVIDFDRPRGRERQDPLPRGAPAGGRGWGRGRGRTGTRFGAGAGARVGKGAGRGIMEWVKRNEVLGRSLEGVKKGLHETIVRITTREGETMKKGRRREAGMKNRCTHAHITHPPLPPSLIISPPALSLPFLTWPPRLASNAMSPTQAQQGKEIFNGTKAAVVQKSMWPGEEVDLEHGPPLPMEASMGSGQASIDGNDAEVGGMVAGGGGAPRAHAWEGGAGSGVGGVGERDGVYGKASMGGGQASIDGNDAEVGGMVAGVGGGPRVHAWEGGAGSGVGGVGERDGVYGEGWMASLESQGMLSNAEQMGQWSCPNKRRRSLDDTSLPPPACPLPMGATGSDLGEDGGEGGATEVRYTGTPVRVYTTLEAAGQKREVSEAAGVGVGVGMGGQGGQGLGTKVRGGEEFSFDAYGSLWPIEKAGLAPEIPPAPLRTRGMSSSGRLQGTRAMPWEEFSPRAGSGVRGGVRGEGREGWRGSGCDNKKEEVEGRGGVEQKSALGEPQPPRVIFKERWSEKEARIRRDSDVGQATGWRLLPVIVKAMDDLRQEQLASQFLVMANLILEEGPPTLRSWLRPYDIVATSPDAGIIEAVPDTVSLDALKKNDGRYTTLLDFFQRHFGPRGSDAFNSAQSCFVESLATYSIVTYLLQVKDRHNGNILLDASGHVIHIDFGFMLANSPGGNINFESAPFKLTAEFVELMDGPSSSCFKGFKEVCVQTFMTLRRQMHRLVLLVETSSVGNAHLPCFGGHPEGIVDDLKARFCPELHDRAAIAHVHRLIDQAMGSWRTTLYDRYQSFKEGIAM